MSIEQTEKVDIVTIHRATGDAWLTISDHLPWDQDEEDHLVLLQEKINAYLRFARSGEVYEACPETEGRNIVINVAGRFPLSKTARQFFEKATVVVRDAGFRLQFEFLPLGEVMGSE